MTNPATNGGPPISGSPWTIEVSEVLPVVELRSTTMNSELEGPTVARTVRFGIGGENLLLISNVSLNGELEDCSMYNKGNSFSGSVILMITGYKKFGRLFNDGRDHAIGSSIPIQVLDAES